MTEPTLDPAAIIGRTFADGRYRIVRQIGSGAMGSVYEAVHEALGRRVAIKLLHPEMMQRPRYAERFRREARAASLLRHRNSVQLLDFGNDGPFFYLVMELLHGPTLGDVIDQGPLPASRAIHVMAQVCAALGAAHDQSIVHRDIKPSNILLTPWIDDDGRQSELVKVLDFGIAKIQSHEDDDPVDRTLTLEGDVCGTPEYMSPEQAEGRKLDNRSDLYACGIVLFHMLTGDVPFYGDTPLSTMIKQVSEAPPSLAALNPTVSPELETIVLRCLAKKREDRFPTVRALRTALLRLPEAAPAPGIISEQELPPVRGVATTAMAPAAGLAPTTDEHALSAEAKELDGTAVTPAVTDPQTRASAPAVPTSEASPAPRRRKVWLVAAALALIAAGVGAWIVTSSRGVAPAPGDVSAVDQPTHTPPPTLSPSEPVAAVAEPDVVEADTVAVTVAVAEVPDATAGEDVAVAAADTEPGDVVSLSSEDTPSSDAEPVIAAAAGDSVEVAAISPRPSATRRATHRTRRPKLPPPTEPEATAADVIDGIGVADVVHAPPEVADTSSGPSAVEVPAVVAAPVEPETHVPPPETVAPPPEPVAPPPEVVGMDCSVGVGGLDVSGGLPRSVVQRALARVEDDVADCYRAAAKTAGHGLAGSLAVSLRIDVDGRARNVEVGHFGLPGVASCVEHAYARVRSLHRPDTGTIRASFSVRFTPRSL